MIIFVIGPSKAGKTAATTSLLGTGQTIRDQPLERIDLDEILGSSNRGIAECAVNACKTIADCHDRNVVLMIDVGAGQLVEPTFRSFLETCGAYPSRTVVIDCGEHSFRERHGENAVNEVRRYYGAGSLEVLWQQAKLAGRCVNSSGSFAPERWAEQLRFILETLANDAG